MAQTTVNDAKQWEKQPSAADSLPLKRKGERLKFMIGGLLILGAVGYLMISGTLTGARFFITVDEVVNNSEYMGETVRLTGAVIGETIDFQVVEGGNGTTLSFVISHIPEDYDDLALTLNRSVNDENSTRLQIHMENEPMPDLLQHEAQAILTGSIQPDGTFFATELLLKCPSRFDEGGSDMSLGENHPGAPLDNAG